MINDFHEYIYNIILSIIFGILVILTLYNLLDIQKTVIIDKQNNII